METLINEKPQAVGAATAVRDGIEQSDFTLKPSTKQHRMLAVFLSRGAAGLNCFEAANRHHDYILRTTIADFSEFGIQFDRTWEQVPNAFGTHTTCRRYCLADSSVELVKKLLGACHE